MQNTRLTGVVLLIATYACLLSAAQPPQFNYQARLMDNGGLALNGSHSVTFLIYEGGTPEVADSGTQKYKESAVISIQNGVVNHTVGTGTPSGPALTNSVFKTSAELFLQVAVDTESNVVLPRTRLESVPFAINSADGDARIALDGPLPITISQPGSYYLTQNLTLATTNADGIDITTSNVTLDLNGFTLSGPGVSDDFTNGVEILDNACNVVVRNGMVVSWGNTVIGASSDSSSGIRIEDIVATNNHPGNGGNLLLGTGPNSKGTIIQRCFVYKNGCLGCIQAGQSALIADCVVYDNFQGNGIAVNSNSIVRNCTSSDNIVASGIFVYGSRCVVENCVGTNNRFGFTVGTGSTVRDCTGSSNTQSGFFLNGGDCALEHSAASSNGNHGIEATNHCAISNCVSTSNTKDGINARNECLIRDCLVQNSGGNGIVTLSNSRIDNCNISLSAMDGINCLSSNQVANCNLLKNGGAGVNAGLDCSVRECKASDSGTTGILTSGRCTVLSNHCDGKSNGGNAGDGIAVGSDSRVEGNFVVNNVNGIIAPTSCIVVHNSAVHNTNNYVGTGAIAAPQVNQAGLATNTSPHANYSF